MSLRDQHGRVVKDLRISVTPRCNLRCLYCDPLGASHSEPQGTLSVADVEHVLQAGAQLGLSSVRFTGGEPLLRKELPRMVELARRTPGITDVALTTNGTLLRRRAKELVAAGLQRVNISLDALDPAVFAKMTDGGDARPTLDAVELALELGLHPVKLNAVSLRGVNESELLPLAELTRARPVHVRFIEYMHLNNAETSRYTQGFLAGREVKARLERSLGALLPLPWDGQSPARVYRWEGAAGTVGFINPISEPFCSGCSRMRLTADRKLRPCLLTERELDAADAFEAEAPVDALVAKLREAAHSKGASGDTLPVLRARTMVGIGG